MHMHKSKIAWVHTEINAHLLKVMHTWMHTCICCIRLIHMLTLHTCVLAFVVKCVHIWCIHACIETQRRKKNACMCVYGHWAIACAGMHAYAHFTVHTTWFLSSEGKEGTSQINGDSKEENRQRWFQGGKPSKQAHRACRSCCSQARGLQTMISQTFRPSGECKPKPPVPRKTLSIFG